ncbi:hypothetical protein B0A55_09881 [Friedmanniomyces simplex]|uniref:NAD(P)-binding domain-containing protein n=1 Tax=Friedmanniomyces simplex TaxID=329884 RepID=A0A4U0WTZ1_9PEZI|nr:hypothetical protein B0A55_09881 [Friedmanniomyces simplex]
MRVLIFGASGRTGQLATTEALARGHTVIVLVRKASSMTPAEGLTIIEGSPLNQPDVERAFTEIPKGAPEAILVTLAAPRATDSPFAKPIAPPFFMRDSVRNVTAVMKQHGVKRIVIMSAFGAGDSSAQLAWPLRLLFRQSNMSFQYEDHDALDADVRVSGDLEWTLVRPVMLKEGEARSVRELGEVGEGAGMFDSVTRASVAEFLVKAVEEGRLAKKAVVIAN